MGDPILVHENPVLGGIAEIISGMSTLNMEPKPLPVPKGAYLSETDEWVEHAMKHFGAAIDILRRAEKAREHIVTAVEFLKIGLEAEALEILKIAKNMMEGKPL